MEQIQLFSNASKKPFNIPTSILMSGYIDREYGNMGVHDELFTRCVTLYDGNAKLIIISNDLLEVDREITLSVRKALSKELTVPFENIMICSSHTHSGPAITVWDFSVKEYVENEEIKKLKNEIIKTIIENALASNAELKPACIGFVKSECSEVAGNRVDEKSISDYSVNTVKISDYENNIIALIVNYTCHPTVLGANNLLISADYPGVLCNRLEKYFANSTVLFLNGACGNQSTRFRRRSQDFEEVERMGGLLFDNVINALSNIGYTSCFDVLKATMENVVFPKKNFPPRDVLIRNLEDAERVKNDISFSNLPSGEGRLAITRYQGALISLRLSEILGSLDEINSEIQVFKIGNVEIVGVPVELFVEYGIEIKSKSLSPNTIIAGYANEVLGYVYTRDAFEKGGYEAYASPFSPDAGEYIVSRVLEMERRLI